MGAELRDGTKVFGTGHADESFQGPQLVGFGLHECQRFRVRAWRPRFGDEFKEAGHLVADVLGDEHHLLDDLLFVAWWEQTLELGVELSWKAEIKLRPTAR